MPVQKLKEEMPSRVRMQVELLKHNRWEVRERAATELGNIGDAAAVPNLLHALQDRESYHVRGKAAWALGQIGHTSAVSHLIKTVKEDDAAVRLPAVEALGNLRHESAVPQLIQTLQREKDKKTRLATVEALGKIGSASAAPALGKLITHKQQRLNRTASEALRQIGIALWGRPINPTQLRMISILAKRFQEDEKPEVVREAYKDAINGDVTPKTAPTYLEELRAKHGSLK